MRTTTLSVTTGADRFTDLTGHVRDFLTGVAGDGDWSGDGLLDVFLPHATAGVAIFELGAGSEADLSSVLDEVFPRDDRWRHAHGSRGHGADHVVPAFVAPSMVVPVVDGQPALGTWQSIVLVDPNVDNRTRTVRLSLLTD